MKFREFISTYFCEPLGNRLPNQGGFSLADLMVTLGVMSLILGMAMPRLMDLESQMNASNDARLFSAKMNYWRTEAVRLRQPITISFTSPLNNAHATYGADLDNNGEVDEEVELSAQTYWIVDGSEGVPFDLEFDALGKIRNLGPEGVALGLENKGQVTNLTILQSGLLRFAENQG